MTKAEAAKPRRVGGLFVAEAPARLLPMSLPLRFFGAAVVFHALGWLMLLLHAGSWADTSAAWPGGLGWPLAALHAWTLGTLLACAIGASLQLLPVATKQGLPSLWRASLLGWLYLAGVLLVVLAMGLPNTEALAVGATMVIAALLGWGWIVGANLRGARGMPGVALHGWGSLAALALLGFSAAALVALWLGRPLAGRDLLRELHLLAGVFGVMGLLVLGFSHILLPLFLLAPVPADRPQLAAGAWALAALALALMAALLPLPQAASWAVALRLAAWAGAVVASLLHAKLVRGMAAGAMRPALGRAGRLMRVAWASAALALALALPLALGFEHPLLARLFALAAIGGWLGSFLFAALQRIVPFLGSMHAAGSKKRPPTPSALTYDPALAWHERCHVAALALLAAAAAAASPLLARLAMLVGLAGAVSFGIFFAVLLVRLRRHARRAADLT
jgi:hypothetical protein